ncbi:MAG: YicC family protein [Bdellovibrionales bacterium]|nr:YicC family protein [Bdellovibrionales bacterium]
MSGKSKAAPKRASPFSMTGFGRSSQSERGIIHTVEIRSVNSRFLDLVLRLPAGFTHLESEIRKVLAAKLHRGRVEVTISREVEEARDEGFHFNESLLRSVYAGVAAHLENSEIWSERVRESFVSALLQRREILEFEAVPEDITEEKGLIFSVLADALLSLLEARKAEGASLGKDVETRVSFIEELVNSIEARQGNRPAELQKRFEERLSKLTSEREIDPERLALEVAILSDRIDISEEITRLKTHLSKTRETLGLHPCGRKLDFFTQEIGRELNTISSKAQDSEIQHSIIEAKAELEKIREQAANIE